jgi:hypothetical protein
MKNKNKKQVKTLDSSNEKLLLSDVMCCFNEMTVSELKGKLNRTWIEETTNSGQVYRQYFTKKQVNKLLEILVKK